MDDKHNRLSEQTICLLYMISSMRLDGGLRRPKEVSTLNFARFSTIWTPGTGYYLRVSEYIMFVN